MRKFTKKEHLKFHKLAVSLFNKNESNIKHELAEYEMRHGEEARKEVEFELNLLRREEQYKKEAQIFYDIVSNIGKYPEDYKHFPKIKKEIFKQFNAKKQKFFERARKKVKKNQKLIEELLLYRIKHMPTRFNPHLMPEGMKGISAEVTMEAERLYYIYKSMFKHHEKHPTSTRFGLSKEERDILEKIRTGYFERRMRAVEKKQIKARKKKQKIQARIEAHLTEEEEKEIAKEYSKKVWYRTEKLKPEVVKVLKKVGYQAMDMSHRVFDFNGKLVACLGFKPEGFQNEGVSVDKRETLQHFSRPYLLKEISPSTQILVRITDDKGEERVVDAVMTFEEKDRNLKVAVEFQDSHTLDALRIQKKLEPLFKLFDLVVVVCHKPYIRLYKKIDNPKLKVLNYDDFEQLLKDKGIIEEKPQKTEQATQDNLSSVQK